MEGCYMSCCGAFFPCCPLGTHGSMPFVEAIYAGGGWVAIWLGRMACNISEGNAAALGGCM